MILKKFSKRKKVAFYMCEPKITLKLLLYGSDYFSKEKKSLTVKKIFLKKKKKLLR